jgi:16S rRNA processing protein RimM
LLVGALVGAHGIQGEVKLRPLTEFPERLSALKELRVRNPEGEETTYALRGSRWHKEMLLVRLAGVTNRDQADELRGCSVVVGLEEAAPLPEGRFYEHQILGLRVVTPQGEELGRVREIMRLPSNDVYVAGNLLIPATHDAIVRLDPEEGVLVVRSREYLQGEEVR